MRQIYIPLSIHSTQSSIKRNQLRKSEEGGHTIGKEKIISVQV
jgi:hypothetical protein